MDDMTSALYFSAVTYTTTGYGDLVLPAEWRGVGAGEALTGILMCGWSTGFFFAVVHRMLDAKPVQSSRPLRQGRLDASVRNEPHQRDREVDPDRDRRMHERQRYGGEVQEQ
jgi:hypothetical protein